MKYSLVFLFNKELDKVLLIHKNKGPYSGSWNGVGGKTEQYETNCECVKREVKEKIDITITEENKLHFLMEIFFYTGAQLSVYVGMLKDTDLPKQMESEEICWFDVNDILNETISLAGGRNIPNMVLEGLYLLRNLD